MDTPRLPRGFDVRIIPFISHLYDSISFVTRLDSPRLRMCVTNIERFVKNYCS